jgi:hypothetical protein
VGPRNGDKLAAFLPVSVPHMSVQGYDKIIGIGSGSAYRGIPWMLHYVTSRGARVSGERG